MQKTDLGRLWELHVAWGEAAQVQCTQADFPAFRTDSAYWNQRFLCILCMECLFCSWKHRYTLRTRALHEKSKTNPKDALPLAEALEHNMRPVTESANCSISLNFVHLHPPPSDYFPFTCNSLETIFSLSSWIKHHITGGTST